MGNVGQDNPNIIEKIGKERCERYKGSRSKDDRQVLSHADLEISRPNVTVLGLFGSDQRIIFRLHKLVH